MSTRPTDSKPASVPEQSVGKPVANQTPGDGIPPEPPPKFDVTLRTHIDTKLKTTLP